MEIEQRIEAVQSRLIKTLTETNFKSKEDAIKQLERVGLDVEVATKLIEAYQNAENAKNAVKSVWENALGSRVESESTVDIAKSQQQEADTRQHFDELASKCALLILARILDPNKINDEILEKLYEYGIQEDQINNPALKITYHYYCESMEKEKDKIEETERIRGLSTKVKSGVMILEQQIKDLKSQNKDLQSQIEVLNKAYKNLQDRMGEGEQRYQQALSLSRELKVMINQLQSRGIFQVIGDKILGRNITRRLPITTDELPKTLYEKAEKIRMPEIDRDILVPTSGEHTQPSSNNQAEKDEMQQ